MQWSFADDARLESLGSAKRNCAHRTTTGNENDDDLDYNDELICNATVIISAAIPSNPPTHYGENGGGGLAITRCCFELTLPFH